jgi:hypothetical protein
MSAITTSWLEDFITGVAATANGMAGVTEGSYVDRTRFPWAFVNADAPGEPNYHIYPQYIWDVDESVSVLVVGKTVDQVRLGLENIMRYMANTSNWTAMLAHGVWNIKAQPRSLPMPIGKPANDVYGGEITFTVSVRYQST